MKPDVINVMKVLHHVRLALQSVRSSAAAARGFTAVELMVVIAIATILMALAAPSFDYVIKRWRVIDAREALTSALYLARSEAIKRGGNVVMAQTPSDANCTLASPASWGCGWAIYFDANSNGAMDAGEQIQSYPAPKGLTVELGASSQIVFDRWGVADTGSLAATIFPSSDGDSSPATSTLCMNSSGRIKYLPGAVSASCN